MGIDDIAKKVSEYAPAIGTLFGSPAGGLAIALVARIVGEAHSGDFKAKVADDCKDTADKLKKINDKDIQAIGRIIEDICFLSKRFN
jgi:hypothetical protein